MYPFSMWRDDKLFQKRNPFPGTSKDSFLDAEMIHPINPGLVILNAQRKYLKRRIPFYRKRLAFLSFDVYCIIIIKRVPGDLTLCLEMVFTDSTQILKNFSTFSIRKR